MTLYSNRQVAVCEFGDKLANKCELSEEYLDLIAEVETLNGNSFSDPDRRAEHHVIELVKCMLNSYVTGPSDTIDATTMSNCLANGMAPYSTAIGVLDKKQDEFNALMAAAQFSCQETDIVFDGAGSWVIHETYDGGGDVTYPPYSTSYVLQTAGEEVVDITGDVFAICETL